MSASSDRPFVFHRHEDVNGVSGTGLVAHGIRHADGSATVWWLGKWPTETRHRSMESVIGIHGHGGRTEIRWCDFVNGEWTIPFGPNDGRFTWVEDDGGEYRSSLDLFKEEARKGKSVIVLAKDERDRSNLERQLASSGIVLWSEGAVPSGKAEFDTIVMVGFSNEEIGQANRLRRKDSRDTVIVTRQALWTLPSMPSSSPGWLWIEGKEMPHRWTGGAWDKPYVGRLVSGDHLCAVDGMGGDQVWVADDGPGSDRLTLLQLLCVTSKIYVTRCIAETGGERASVPIKVR